MQPISDKRAKGIRKAAVLLLSLDRTLSAEVLSQLSKDSIESVALEIARLDDVTQTEQETVLEEFYLQGRARRHIESGGIEHAYALLEQSMGKAEATEIIDSLRQSMSSVPFGFLHKVPAENVITFIVEEHPQTIALIISHLPSGLGAEVLSGLPTEKQTDVVRRVATMEQTSPEVIRDVESSLHSRMRSVFSQSMEKAGGVEAVAQMLNVADRMTNKGILESLEEDNPDLVDEIKRLMFVFDDILKLDDKSVQALLKEVDNSQWAMALKGASEDLKGKILGNLSQRASAMLEEEMDYLGPVKLSDVEAMQQQIVDIIRRLEDSGEISVSAGNDAEQLIS